MDAFPLEPRSERSHNTSAPGPPEGHENLESRLENLSLNSGRDRSGPVPSDPPRATRASGNHPAQSAAAVNFHINAQQVHIHVNSGTSVARTPHGGTTANDSPRTAGGPLQSTDGTPLPSNQPSPSRAAGTPLPPDQPLPRRGIPFPQPPTPSPDPFASLDPFHRRPAQADPSDAELDLYAAPLWVNATDAPPPNLLPWDVSSTFVRSNVLIEYPR